MLTLLTPKTTLKHTHTLTLLQCAHAHSRLHPLDLMLMKKKFLFVPTTTSQCINDKTEYEPTAKRLS